MGDWKGSLTLLREAVAAKETPKLKAKTYGLRFVNYLPYFHIGEAYYHLKEKQKAVDNFDLCLKYGEMVTREVLMARRIRPSIIQCHSLSSLPAAVLTRAAARTPLVYDARELETETNGLRGVNQVFARRLEKTLIRHCDAVLCVSDSIADWYAHEYRIPRPFVVRNIPDVRAQSAFAALEILRAQCRIPARPSSSFTPAACMTAVVLIR